MGIIIATDRDGTEYRIEGRDRASFMELLRRAGLSLEALCAGSCQCATCQILVDEAWLSKLPPASEFETATLESEVDVIAANARLSCQIQWQEDLDGIRVTIAPAI
ncbi:MAG: 2Fe-2S iron-sulfur cluster-binding protein [Pseudomonadales bacterium]|nr:2Fe-2S iron-sulfur cluster-binding protein [Pseudomonadales bacterium]